MILNHQEITVIRIKTMTSRTITGEVSKIKTMEIATSHQALVMKAQLFQEEILLTKLHLKITRIGIGMFSQRLPLETYQITLRIITKASRM